MDENTNTTIQSLNITDLARDTNNIYKSVVVVGMRASQIAGQLKSELNNKLAEFASFSDTLEEVVENREQIEIARHYEQVPKPTLLAVQEFLHDKIEYQDPNP